MFLPFQPHSPLRLEKPPQTDFLVELELLLELKEKDLDIVNYISRSLDKKYLNIIVNELLEIVEHSCASFYKI